MEPQVLILGCQVEKGNPADSTMAMPMLEAQLQICGRPPRQAAMDVGLASTGGLRDFRGGIEAEVDEPLGMSLSAS